MKGICKIMIVVNIIIDCLLCPAMHEAFYKTQELQPLKESVAGIIIIVLDSMMSPRQGKTMCKVLP